MPDDPTRQPPDLTPPAGVRLEQHVDEYRDHLTKIAAATANRHGAESISIVNVDHAALTFTEKQNDLADNVYFAVAFALLGGAISALATMAITWSFTPGGVALMVVMSWLGGGILVLMKNRR